ncbi:GumC family protein [Rhodocaloribacter sp.]
MSLPPPSETFDELIHPPDPAREMRADQNLWSVLGTLYRRRRFIAWVTGGAAVLSVVISLLLPNWYKGSTRLLLPEGASGGLASALLGDLSSAAQSILGGGGDYTRYMAILSSRTMLESVVDAFDLVHVYEFEDSDTPREDAVEALADNAEFLIDDEYEFLSVEVYDKDPQRAADMANFFVARLNEINGKLSSETAGNFRKYVQRRYLEAEQARAALLDSLQAFQEHYGVFDLEAQTTAYFEQIAQLRVNALQLEIQYEALRSSLGPENPQVRNLRALVEAAEGKYEQALNGRERVLPIAQDEVPAAVRRYAELTLERTIQERTLELVAPMLEQARFEEERDKEAVQVLDPAVPPVEKAKPKRSIICIAATLSAFLLAVIFVLTYEWWQRNHAVFARRLREAAADGDAAANGAPSA